MDTVARYREIVTEVLTTYSQQRLATPQIEVAVLFDPLHDQYALIHTGWTQQQRQYGPILHLAIRNGKVWIEHDGTEGGVAEQLVAAGIPRHDIVLAFHSPFKRQFTQFAVG